MTFDFDQQNHGKVTRMREKVEPFRIAKIACEVTENCQRPLNFSLLRLSRNSYQKTFLTFEKQKVRAFFTIHGLSKKNLFSWKKMELKCLDQIFHRREFRFKLTRGKKKTAELSGLSTKKKLCRQRFLLNCYKLLKLGHVFRVRRKMVDRQLDSNVLYTD